MKNPGIVPGFFVSYLIRYYQAKTVPLLIAE